MQTQQNRKIILKRRILIVLMFVFLSGMLFSGYQLLRWKKDTKENHHIEELLHKSIHVEKVDNNMTYFIDWKTIQKNNSDAIAYLKVRNTKIDSIVVKGKDNSYYLTHNFNKDYNSTGWVFMDYHNQMNETDKNIVIYGHNVRDGSMFGSLKTVLDPSWYKEEKNWMIDVVTPTETKQYQVFSIYEIPKEDYYINTVFSEKEYQDFLKTIQKRSIYSFPVELEDTRQILTLSTCSAGEKRRTVLHAKEVVNME